MGRCILCHGLKFNEVNNYRQPANIYDQTQKVLLPQDVINSCGKYLQNFIQSVDWDVPARDGEAFCSECYENTNKLSKLNVQIEIIENEITQLVNNIAERISRERRNYELLDNVAGSIAAQIQNASLIPYPIHNHQNSETPIPICEIVIDTEHLQQTNEYYCGSESESNNNDDPTTGIGIVETTIENPTSTSSSRPTIKVKQDKKPTRDSIAKGFARNDSVVVTSTDLHQRVNDGYECQKCHKKFTHLTILQRHDCGNPTDDCDICGKSFSSHASLKLHSKTHTGEKPHKCEYCGKRFGLPHHLRMHIRSHTGEKPYQCKFCEKRFSDFKCYKTHLLGHSSDESLKRKFKCDLCLKTFTLFATLKRHYGVHKGDTPFKCEICGKSFVHSKSLQNHKVVHSKERAYECKSCGRTYKRLDTLKVHELTHTQEKSFQCEQCGKIYHTQRKLREHISACHKEEGEFICETCGKTCINSTLLKSHKRIHDKNPNKEKIKCAICKKEYAEKTALLKHLKTVHIVTTGHTAPCSKCGVSYNNIVDLENHKQTKHSHGFQYKCKLCKIEISSRCELTCHYAETHKEEEMPYKCKICKITFKSKVELTRHNTEQPCVAPIQSVKTTRRKQVLSDTVNSDDDKCYSNESDSDYVANSKNSNKSNKKKLTQKRRGRKRGRKKVKKVVTYKEETSESEECSDVVVKIESNDWIKEELEDYTD